MNKLPFGYDADDHIDAWQAGLHDNHDEAEAKAAAVETAPETSIPAPAFKVGDKVHWYNGYDLYIGLVTITDIAKPYAEWEPWCQHRYYVSPIDTPWCPLRESHLVPEAALPNPPAKGTPRQERGRA